MERYTCRKSPVIRVALAAIAMVLITLCMFATTQAAYADESIELGKPQWNDAKTVYTLPELTVTTDATYTTAIVSVDAGYMTTDNVDKDIVQSEYEDLTRTTYTMVFKDGTTIAEIQAALREFEFHLPSNSAVSQKPKVKLSTRETILPDGAKVTAGTGTFAGHYYVFVSEYQTWTGAYSNAKTFRYMGMQGYLATVINDAENSILDNITSAGAWSGGTRALIGGQLRLNDPDAVSFSDLGFPSSHGSEVFYWSCGPEAGHFFSEYNYSPWNSGEPNNAFGPGGQTEGFLQVHHTNGRWNDLPNDPTTEYITGYFVEFGGYGEDDPGYEGEYSEIESNDSIVVITPVSVTGLTASNDRPYFGEGASELTATVAPANATFVTYQWYRSDAEGATTGGTAIEGATEASYTPTQDDEGYYLYCIASGELDSSAAAAFDGKVLPLTATVTYEWYGSNDVTINNGEAAAGSTWAIPTNEGATFMGWYLEDAHTTLFADATGALALPAAEGIIAQDGTWEISSAGLTLYPKWEPIGDAEAVARMFVANPQNGNGDDNAWESDEIAVAWNDATGAWDMTLKDSIDDAAIAIAELQSGAGIEINLDMNGKSITGASSDAAAGTPGLTLGDRASITIANGTIQGGDGTTGAAGIEITGSDVKVVVGDDAIVRGGKTITPGGDSGSGIETSTGAEAIVSVNEGGSVEGGTSTAAGSNGGDGIAGNINVYVTGGSVAGGAGAAGENGGDGGNGGDGINSDSGASISGGVVMGGDGGAGGSATGDADGGNGGDGGTGVTAHAGLGVTGGEVSGGAGGDGGSAENGDGGEGGKGGSSINGTGGEGGMGGSSVTGNGGDGGNGGASDTGNGGAGGEGGSSTDGDGGNGGTGGASLSGTGGTGGAGGDSTNGAAGAGGNGGASTFGETGAGGAGGSSVNGTAGTGGEGSPAGESGEIDYSPAETFVNTYLKAIPSDATPYADVDGENYAQIISGADAWDALSEVQQTHVNQILADADNAATADTYPEMLATALAGTAFTSLYLTDDEVIYSAATADNHVKIAMGEEPWNDLSDASKSVVNGMLADNGNSEAYDTYPEMLAAVHAMEDAASSFLETYLTDDGGNVYTAPTAANNAQITSGAEAWNDLSDDAQALVNKALADNGNAAAYDTYPEMLVTAQTQANNANAFVRTYLTHNGVIVSEPSTETANMVVSGAEAWNDLSIVEQELVNAALANNGNEAPYDTYEGLYTPSHALAFANAYLTEDDGSIVSSVTEDNAMAIVAGEDEWNRMSQNERALVNDMLAGNDETNDTYEELLAQAKEVAEAMSDIEVFRLYDPITGDHLYTTSDGERKAAIAGGWHDEGVGFTTPATKGDPVYRVFNPVVGGHHYTTNESERDALVKSGWRDEGVAFLSADPSKGSPVRRLYNPGSRAVCHLFTTSLTEASNVEAAGWTAEGIAFYSVS